MATTFKLVSAAASDGVIYLDVPVSGKITNVKWAGQLSSGAGGIGIASGELSRVAVNQMAVSNPRGVLDAIILSTQAASTGAAVNQSRSDLDEPIKAGERLYLNCAGYSQNVGSVYVHCYITIA